MAVGPGSASVCLASAVAFLAGRCWQWTRPVEPPPPPLESGLPRGSWTGCLVALLLGCLLGGLTVLRFRGAGPVVHQAVHVSGLSAAAPLKDDDASIFGHGGRRRGRRGVLEDAPTGA